MKFRKILFSLIVLTIIAFSFIGSSSAVEKRTVLITNEGHTDAWIIVNYHTNHSVNVSIPKGMKDYVTFNPTPTPQDSFIIYYYRNDGFYTGVWNFGTMWLYSDDWGHWLDRIIIWDNACCVSYNG